MATTIAIVTSVDLAEPNACIANIAGVAQGLVQAGFEVMIIAPVPSKSHLAIDFSALGITVHFTPPLRILRATNTFGFIRMLPTLWVARHRMNISVFYVRYSPLSVLAIAFLKLLGRTFVMSEHNGWFANEAAQRGYPAWLCRLGRITQQIDAKLADRVRVVTSDIADKLAQRGIPRDKILVSENATMIQRFHPIDRATAIKRMGLDPTHLWVGFMGTLNIWQGVDLALKAFERLKDRFPQLHFLIAGDGPAKLQLEAQARELGIADRTNFLGWVSLDRANDVLNCFDIALAPFPSNRPIGSPVKLRDYAAAGRAIVASDFSAIRRIASSDWLTLYRSDDVVDLAAKIELMADDVVLRARLAARAREVAEAQFAWTPIIAEIVEHLPPP